MKSRRILLITRRYWPLVGGAERAMAGLAQEFHQQGHQVQVLTARWENHWPEELIHREVKVTRLANPKTRGWGTFRYMRSLNRWLNKHAEEFEIALVSMLKHDAHVTIKALGKQDKPVLIRAEGAGPTGDVAFHSTARFGSALKKSCARAAAIVAPSEAVQQELLSAGFRSDIVQYIANGVEIQGRNRSSQIAARRSLADAHPILSLDPGEPLVVYTGRLDIQKGLIDLVDAWKEVAKVFPNGRLWLVGEGMDGRVIWDRIRESRQTANIIMPGSFDDVSDLLCAADAFVLPSYQEGMSLSLLEAMANELPVVVSDIPGNIDLVTKERGFLFPTKQVGCLANALLAAIQKQEVAKKLASNARTYVADNFSLNKMARGHLDLMESVLSP